MEDNLFELSSELKNKEYKHSNYTAFCVSDPKLRRIHKATVRDRVLHHAIFRILYPLFDKSFIFDSYSCRFDKGTHRAVNRLAKFLGKLSHNNRDLIFALKCDIRKFFASINQNILLRLITKKIKDENSIWLIEKIIRSFSRGLPLGNVTSQIFANIYLNELDQFVKHKLKVKYYLRYCDDFIILSQDKEYLKNLILLIDNFLNKTLNLSIHPDKIIIKKYSQGIDFLGYVVLPCHRALRTKSRRRIFKKIKISKEKLKAGFINNESFNQSLQSYYGMLKHCNGYKLKIKVDKIINN
ncbi:RNA-dependent DNA polymerase [Candidatus Falkowbacteria bacterium]|nr:RNA-dependent DNA polymerase [Candidatus Falkowbacteria bacterium]